MVQYTDLVSDTICAQITPQGYSGVSLIRVSGPNALLAVRQLCPQLPRELKSHQVYLATLIDPQTEQNIDQVLVTFFAHGKSFTGDEVIELACHGSPLLTQKVISLFLQRNCRIAERGEFTFRAFYNGKIDLVQAESINQLIVSNSGSSANQALKNLYGNLSEVYQQLEKEVLHILAHLEAAIDFVEQDIDPSSYAGLSKNFADLSIEVDKLIESYDIGRKLTENWRILLVGETNVGKSSLFNKVFNEDKAIVTSVPGTTRDLVQDDFYIGSHSVKFIDSAGLRENPEEIERIGIDKTLQESKNAAVILWVIDGTKEVPWNVIELLGGSNILAIVNKVDLVDELKIKSIEQEILGKSPIKEVFKISAKTGQGIDKLLAGLKSLLDVSNSGDFKALVTQSRHFDHLKRLKISLSESEQMLLAEVSPDIISQELQIGLSEIQKLLGKTFDDEILDTIFSEFCIGK